MTRFMTIGRVLYDKGFKELIECASFYKKRGFDVEFQWLGGIDPDYPQFVSQDVVMKYHNLGVINYVGFKSDVKGYLASADCIIHPSYHEGMSRVLMESLAMHKPIITTNIPGCKETVIEGVNGFLCEPRDSLSLIKAVEKFLSLSSDQRFQMGIESRQYAESRFDIKNVIKVYDEVLNSISCSCPTA